MATTDTSNSDLARAEILWKSADTLRGQIDAAEYKHVVLGLHFLKYISDSFDARCDELKVDLAADGITGLQVKSLLENRDEYTAERVFWVPPESRWQNLQNQAARADVAKLIDDAILTVERDNTNLKGKLPRDYARRGIAPEKMKGLIDLVADIGFKGDRSKARDTLGRVYEYFLSKFAAAEGKLGGEFFTPRSIVRLLVEMLEPCEGRVYDPCCGSAGMFVQSERFVEAHGGQKIDLSIFGQESNPTTWRLAHMNLAIRGIEANLCAQPADSFLRNLHPDLKADYILANPPFNISDWSGKLLAEDVRWRFGSPPTGNANYAWIQHFIHHLAPPNGPGGGLAGFVMANGSLSSGYRRRRRREHAGGWHERRHGRPELRFRPRPHRLRLPPVARRACTHVVERGTARRVGLPRHLRLLQSGDDRGHQQARLRAHPRALRRRRGAGGRRRTVRREVPALAGGTGGVFRRGRALGGRRARAAERRG